MEFLNVFRRVLTFEFAVASAVFALVLLAMLLAIVLSRKRSGDKRKRDSNRPFEATYGVLLAAVAGVIVYLTASANEEVQRGPTGYGVGDQAGAAAIDVTAFQWCWRFDYPGSGRSVTGTCQEDNADLPTLVVPTGRPVELRLRSSDVIHSLWIADKAIKMDVFPNHTNTLTVRFDKQGRWLGRCAEFCGPYHASMHFYVKAVSPAKFRQWQQQGAAA